MHPCVADSFNESLASIVSNDTTRSFRSEILTMKHRHPKAFVTNHHGFSRSMIALCNIIYDYVIDDRNRPSHRLCQSTPHQVLRAH